MLYFCSVAQISAVVQSASRYDDMYDLMRKSVSGDFNKFMRRTLDYAGAVVELLDVGERRYNETYVFYLEKKNITPGSLEIRIARSRDWTDVNFIIDPTLYTVDNEKGKVTLFGPLQAGYSVMRVVYAGGYPAIGSTDVMDCPPELTAAAISQCEFRLNEQLNQQQGRGQDVQQKMPVVKRKFVGGLLSEVARTLAGYRKPMGGLV